MKFMAWDLWGPSYNQVAQDSSYYVQPGWQCDFYFGYGVDLIEENALNEKFCVQVLRILITKADTEIDELEKDLVTLQSELAWAECDEWSERCCNTLKEKINYLDISLKNLRNRDKHEVDVHLLMHREPAETVHEIVKALLQNHSAKKDEQPPDVIVKESISDAPAHRADLLDKNRKLSNFDSNVIIKEEVKELIITPSESEKPPISCSSLKFQEEKTNSLEAFKPANTIVKDSSPDSMQLASGYFDEKKISHNNDSKCATKNEAKRHRSTPKDNRMIQSSSLKPTQKMRCNQEAVKPADVMVKLSSSDALKHAVHHSNPKQKLSGSDLKSASEEVEDPTFGAIIVDSSLNPEGRTTSLVSKVKPTNTSKNSGSDAPDATGNSHEMKKLCKVDLEVDGEKEVREQSSATKKSENLSSSLCFEGKGNIPKIEMPAKAVVKYNGEHAPRHATDNGGKEQGSESRSGASSQANNGSPNVEQKLSKIALTLRASPKEGTVMTNKIDLISSLKTKRNRNDTQKVPETGEHSAVTSLLEQQDQRKKDRFNPHSEEGTPQILVLQKAEIDANGNKSSLNKILKPQRKKAKRKIQSNPPSIQEAGALPMGVDLDLPISKVKKRQKSEISNDNVCLSQLFDMKILKKSVHPGQHDAKGRGLTADISKNSIVQLEKKNEKSSSVPIVIQIKGAAAVDMDISDSIGEGTDIARKEVISCSIDGPQVKAMKSSDLNDLKLVELKAIAKQYKLQQYSKLKKEALVKQLTDLLDF